MSDAPTNDASGVYRQTADASGVAAPRVHFSREVEMLAIALYESAARVSHDRDALVYPEWMRADNDVRHYYRTQAQSRAVGNEYPRLP